MNSTQKEVFGELIYTDNNILICAIQQLFNSFFLCLIKQSRDFSCVWLDKIPIQIQVKAVYMRTRERFIQSGLFT